MNLRESVSNRRVGLGLLKIVLLIIIVSSFSCMYLKEKSYEELKFKNNWKSLANRNVAPAWLNDAKFGICFHWGVYTVPAYENEFYPRNMHLQKSRAYQYHLKTYGEVNDFGYHDFVPLFKGEKFNASNWVNLINKAGARFGGVVAEHHDGFAMWESDITPWNSLGKGPLKDVVQEIKRELSEMGMKMITSFHHARNLQRYSNPVTQDRDNELVKFQYSYYPFLKGTPPASYDLELAMLYGNLPMDKWCQIMWLGKLKEVIDNYQPDAILFDSWLDQIPEEYRLAFCTYYFNAAEKQHKDVIVASKQNDLPIEVSVKSAPYKKNINSKLWISEVNIGKGTRSYISDMDLKSTSELLHNLIDVVSKNGVVLLNVAPQPDGVIPLAQRKVLLRLGLWLKEYGDAIYKSRPWYTFGEGPLVDSDKIFSHYKVEPEGNFTCRDVRYTCKGDIVYAILLGCPKGNSKLFLQAFNSAHSSSFGRVKKVEILGLCNKIQWQETMDGLIINMPVEIYDEMATVIKITTDSNR